MSRKSFLKHQCNHTYHAKIHQRTMIGLSHISDSSMSRKQNCYDCLIDLLGISCAVYVPAMSRGFLEPQLCPSENASDSSLSSLLSCELATRPTLKIHSGGVTTTIITISKRWCLVGSTLVILGDRCLPRCTSEDGEFSSRALLLAVGENLSGADKWGADHTKWMAELQLSSWGE